MNFPSDEFRDRLRKLEEMRASGVDPYPHDFRPSMTAQEFLHTYGSHELTEQHHKATESLAGRVVGKRWMGKVAFLHILDRTGKTQVYFKKDHLPEADFEWMKKVDLGDFIGVSGHAFRTKTQELTIDARRARLLCKALRPLPEKWHGLQDVEQRYRQRYLDLISNEQVRETFVWRSRIVQHIREFFTSRGFLEVETPMMQVIPGGARAKPFVTHHNALGLDLFLRIAPELYLKRLVVGGIERVFELNRNFRNEGISTQHNPEFTMLEFYQAYATYEDLMETTEELISGIVRQINGEKQKPLDDLTYQGQVLNFTRPWRKLTLCQALRENLGQCENPNLHSHAGRNLEDLEVLKKIAQIAQLKLQPNWDVGTYQAFLFESLVESHIIQPTFITQFPVAVSPLSKRNPKNPQYTDRFELFIAGREIANAFSELNDPVDQRQRFEAQVKQRHAGDEEAMYFDEDFVVALEHGLPPTAGEGIGIDRLVMLLTDSASIRDVILFPLLRPEKEPSKL